MLSCMVCRLHSNWISKIIYKQQRVVNKIMANTTNVRWAFNAKQWKPTTEEILAASSYIQTEEKERIDKYVFQDDAKSSLVGRLMLRKYVHLSTSIPYEDIRFGRDDLGKPYLLGAGDIPVSFNVSHQGDHVVLAGNMGANIGIDIMKTEPPVNKDIPEFFRLMSRQFSEFEWNTIKSFRTEMEQMSCFYRIWCLKESYVKNIGIGLTIPIKEISFSIDTLKMRVGDIVTDTTLYVKGVMRKDWIFQETLIDDNHVVAVSIHCKGACDDTPVKFEHLTFEELVKEAKPLYSPDEKFSEDFMKKIEKHF